MPHSIPINELCWRVHQTARQKGFWNDITGQPIELLGKAMLIVTEVAELAEEFRKEEINKKACAEELADTVIRVMDLAEALNSNWPFTTK
jgi:hypothetical protein